MSTSCALSEIAARLSHEVGNVACERPANHVHQVLATRCGPARRVREVGGRTSSSEALSEEHRASAHPSP